MIYLALLKQILKEKMADHCKPTLCSKATCKSLEAAVANIFRTLLICNVCLAFPDAGKFLGCEKGHSICVACHSKFSQSTHRFKCPVCREKSQVFENTPLSFVVDELMGLGRINCKNCEEKVTPASYMRHLQYFCTERDFNCPACKSTNSPAQFFDHFKKCNSFYYIMPIGMMPIDENKSILVSQKTKFSWNLIFLRCRLNIFCLIVASEQEYLLSKRELNRLPSHLWVILHETDTCLCLQVRLLRTYFSSENMKQNFDQKNPREFVFKVHSHRHTQSFRFQASDDECFNGSLITKESYLATFEVPSMYELQFELEMVLW